MASLTRWLLISSLALVACAGQPDSTECASGITCPANTRCAAAQQVCITSNCGDGVVQESTGERCDDGNIIDGDGCAANCLSREVCGDTMLNSAAGELCDDGNILGGDGCAADCRSVEVCGNEIKDVGEACDDGNTVSGDGCSGNCRSTEICGNNIVDINEVCDDGTTPGGCNDNCQGGTGCGDGAIDKDINGNPIEECDDGNGDPADDCVACKLSKCGDGVEQTSGARIEQCDPSLNFGETADCNLDCTDSICGDGKINNAALEQCDDKNSTDTDACKNDCKLNYCGDGVAGGPNEACDDGGVNTLDCTSTCKGSTCGDGFVNPNDNETCDSLGVDTATCDANCTAPVCGDGTVNDAAGEDCDDMNIVNEDACRNDCKFNVCGDGLVDSTDEQCDDHNTANEASCPYGMATCNTCNMNCQIAAKTGNVCGDFSVGGPELCDDGNTTTESVCPYNVASGSCTLCNETCLLPLTLAGPTCSDRTTDAPFEACDDGNRNACGTCDQNCNQFASAKATGYIVAIGGADLNDNDTFVLGDGFSAAKIFEFDRSDNGVGTTNMVLHTEVTTTSTATAETMATNIAAAINGSGLNITATVVGGTLVTLTNNRRSTLGNLVTSESVNDQDFVLSDMTGGAGGNCDGGIGCKTGDDCKSGTCTNNLCTAFP